MGSAGSVAKTITREEATFVLNEAFKDSDSKDADEILTLATRILEKRKGEEEKEAETETEKKEEGTDEEGVKAPNIKDTQTVVRDKRGNEITLSQQKVQKIRELFKLVDSDKDHVVGEKEFVDTLENEGMSREDAKRVFEEADDSNSGKITMAKLLQWNLVSTIKSMRDHFKEIDDDSNRQITENEFKDFFLSGGNPRQVVQRLWTKLDSNKNSKINFKEWKAWSEDVLALKSFNDTFGGVLEKE